MDGIYINAERRSITGKSAARRLRANNKIPAIVYGKDIEPIPISVDLREWNRFHRNLKRTTIATLRLKSGDGYEERPVMVKEIQRDYLGDKVLHIDFLQISMERPVEVEVGIHLVGDSIGAKKGGVIEQHLHTVLIECLPGQIPERIDVDISNLDIGDSIHLNEIQIPGVRILGNLEVALVTIVPPTVEEAIPAAEAEEPEKIERERKEKEED
ncbi:MAG: 50S ribosomal protein L25 [Desulfobacterota bacterium]|nr:50S ribosomal protein L25 [Thermodesulfobacteriota bacterium]MDW8002124.1 50S ribosomal protein L25 [Deltaproteobacteria bacterium]